MNRGFRIPWRTATAFATVLLALGVGEAQPPNGRGGDGREPAARADKDVEAWVKVLAEKITDRHDSVRDSARGALVAIGEPALATLRKLAEGDDGAAAEAARHVMAQIEQGPGGPGGFSPGPGFAGPGGGAPPGGTTGAFAPPGPGGTTGSRPGFTPGSPGFALPGGTTGGPARFAPPGGTNPPGFGPPGGGPPGGPGGAPGAPMGPGRAGSVEHALQELNLADKQKRMVDEVLKAHQEKVRQAVKEMHEDLFKAIKEILGEEQYKKFEMDMRQPRPDGPGNPPGGPGNPPGGPPDRPRSPVPF